MAEIFIFLLSFFWGESISYIILFFFISFFSCTSLRLFFLCIFLIFKIDSLLLTFPLHPKLNQRIILKNIFNFITLNQVSTFPIHLPLHQSLHSPLLYFFQSFIKFVTNIVIQLLVKIQWLIYTIFCQKIIVHFLEVLSSSVHVHLIVRNISDLV